MGGNKFLLFSPSLYIFQTPVIRKLKRLVTSIPDSIPFPFTIVQHLFKSRWPGKSRITKMIEHPAIAFEG